MLPTPLFALVGPGLGLLVSMVMVTVGGGLFCVLLPIVVVERLPVFQALSRAHVMIRGELAKGMLAFSFFLLVAGFLPLMLLMLQVGDTPDDMGPLTPLLVMLMTSTVLPLGYGAIMALYLSLRGRDGAGTEQLREELHGAESA